MMNGIIVPNGNVSTDGLFGEGVPKKVIPAILSPRPTHSLTPSTWGGGIVKGTESVRSDHRASSADRTAPNCIFDRWYGQ